MELENVLKVGEVVRFPEKYDFSGPGKEARIIRKYFGEDGEKMRGVVALSTCDYHTVKCESPGKCSCQDGEHPRCKSDGYITFPHADIAYPDMLPICREHFPKSKNYCWIVTRPKSTRPGKILPPDDYIRMMDLWHEYAKDHGCGIDTGESEGMSFGPASDYAFDFQVMFSIDNRGIQETSGFHCYGMHRFVPLDPQECIVDTTGGIGGVIKDLEKSLKGRGKIVSVGKVDSELKDILKKLGGDDFPELPDLPDLPGMRKPGGDKGGKGGSFH